MSGWRGARAAKLSSEREGAGGTPLDPAGLPSQHPLMMDESPDKGPKGPVLSPAGHRAQAENRTRQAAALRENLARRKQQQRARAASALGGEAPPTSKPGGTAGG